MNSASTSAPDNIRPTRHRVIIGLWALWIVFLLIPGLALLGFLIVTLPLEEIESLGIRPGELPEVRAVASLCVGFAFLSGVVGGIVQYVVLGYASPLRLLRQKHRSV
jgi:hypothetical protein